MSIIIYIPFRKGSTRLPGKNTKDLCGRPLYRWTVDYARMLRPFADRIVVSTDDEEALLQAATIPDDRIEVYERLPENATLEATTTSSVKEYLDRAQKPIDDDDIVVLMHVTTIGRVRRDVSDLFELLDRPGVTRAAYMRQLRIFLFRRDPDGFVSPLNQRDEMQYRTQDLHAEDCPYVSFGEISATYASAWRNSRVELTFEPGFCVLPSETLLVDIDTAEDFERADILMAGLLARNKIFYDLAD